MGLKHLIPREVALAALTMRVGPRPAYARRMRLSGGAALAAVALLALTGCAAGSPAPPVTVTTTVSSPAPTVTVTAIPTPEAVTPSPTVPPAGETLDLMTDAGLCAADAELSNLELNDALAPMLGYPANRDARTSDQDEAIRSYKNAAFSRACPARAS